MAAAQTSCRWGWRPITAAGLVSMVWAGPADAQFAPYATRAFAAADSSARVQQVCIASSIADARSCALAKCRKAGGRDCRVMAACDRADWSGTLGVSLQGSRFALTICGVPSRPGLIARTKDLCRGYRSRGLESCTLETVWTPSGEEETAGLRWTRQSLGSGRTVAR